MIQPTAIDLFSGCGGLTLGLKQAGYNVRAAVELDDLAAETYALNHPETHLLRSDIRKVVPAKIMCDLAIAPYDLALLAACAPCQGFSRLSTRNRPALSTDARNDLVLSVLPFAAALKPQSIMLENVPAARDSVQMAKVRGELRRLGYKFVEAVLDVADFGVPQRRKRYILLGKLELEPSFSPKVRSQATVRSAIGKLPLPTESDDALHSIGTRMSDKIRELVSRIPKDGGSRADLPPEFQLACHARSDGFRDVYGRMSWDSPAPTITGGFVNPSKGRFLHPEQDRPISLREGAILQGFGTRYKFSLRSGKYAVAKMIGNAVPPKFAMRQATALLDRLDERII